MRARDVDRGRDNEANAVHRKVPEWALLRDNIPPKPRLGDFRVVGVVNPRQFIP